MKIARLLLRLPVFLVLWLWPQQAAADGKVFRPVLVADDPWIPDQRALLHWMDGEETLVIETSVNGGGGGSGGGQELAWVVPLPSLPEVEEAPAGLFPLLAEAMGPKIVIEKPWWTALLSLTFLTWIILSRKAGYGIRLGVVSLSWAALLLLMAAEQWSAGTVLAIFLLICLPLFVLARSKSGETAEVVWMKWFGIGVLAWAVIFFGSTMSYGKIMAGLRGGVQVLGISQAGRFDVTLLKSDDPEALGKWMGANGFYLPPETRPAVEAYVREGWVFAAMKTRREGERASGPLHPVTFRFKAEAPVYPMRLTSTATQGQPLGLDLFVFGPSSATVPGMEAKRSCLTYPASEKQGAAPGVTASAAGADAERTLAKAPGEVRRWFGDAPVATWLRGVLPVEQLSKDVLPAWTATTPHDPTATTAAGAIHATLNRASLVLGSLLFLIAVLTTWRNTSDKMSDAAAAGHERHGEEEQVPFWRQLWRHPFVATLAALGLAWCVAYGVMLETTSLKPSSRGLRPYNSDESMLAELILQARIAVEELGNTPPENGKTTVAEEVGALFGDLAIVNGLGDSEYGEVLFEESSRGTEIWFKTPKGNRTHIVTVDRNGRTDHRPGRVPLWDIPRSPTDRIQWGRRG